MDLSVFGANKPCRTIRRSEKTRHRKRPAGIRNDGSLRVTRADFMPAARIVNFLLEFCPGLGRY